MSNPEKGDHVISIPDDAYDGRDAKPSDKATSGLLASDYNGASTTTRRIENSTALSIVAYCLSSISMTVVNKYVVSGSSWNLTFFYLAVQAIVSTTAIIFAKRLRMIRNLAPINYTKAKQWFPISLLLVSMIYTGNKALQFLSVPVYTIFKNLTTIVIAYGEVLLFGAKVTPLAFLSFCLMVLSSIIAAWADIQSAANASLSKGVSSLSSNLDVGYTWMGINIVCSAAYILSMRKIIKKMNFSDWDTMFYNNLLTIPILLSCSLMVEDWSAANLAKNFPESSRHSIIAGMIYSGLGAITISYSSAWCIRVTSSTTYSMPPQLNRRLHRHIDKAATTAVTTVTPTMKRKHTETDDSAPKEEKRAKIQEPQPAAKELTFSDLGLDTRLVQGVAAESFKDPTPVQQRAIPLALDGKDIVAKAPCGSGKTAAYVLPVLSSILKRKTTDSSPATTAVILVPTRELADQVLKAIEQFSAYCAKDVHAVKLVDKISDAVQRSLLSNFPDIVISTPATAWRNILNDALSLEKLSYLVLDEADLILSYGYNEDLENIARKFPKGVQLLMMSATLSTDVTSLQGIFARKPTVLDLDDEETEGDNLSQFVVSCAEDEKFLLAFIIFKLKLVKGKCLIFVNDVDRSYRLKLFLEQFQVRSCILNSELPITSRAHVLEEFNRGVYDIIIASDEKSAMGVEEKDGEEEDGGGEKEKEKESKKKNKKKSSKRDVEFGVSRGIDFKNVAAVVNFDLPTSASSYTHRIGRTARAGRTGMALSFYVPKELYRKHMPTSIETAENDEKVLAKIKRQQAKQGKEVKPYNFKKEHLDAFRYRLDDALRAVTKVAVREARMRELKQELLKSEKLKRYFEENPTELQHLRHDGELRTARQQPHLKHIPEYLLPKEGKDSLTSNEVGMVPFRKVGGKLRNKKGKFGRGKKVGTRKVNPLKTFKARRK
ncbi:ATP-dependent RNA helicase DBP9 [Colletotrichum viniferum]|nr:ATP-dependent RNA helicase DBP9 [Colletotrichum viniferum]